MNKQNRADQRKYHFIYKTTCKINSKYYLGMHSTNNLDDGYIGSGTYLWHSIRKYGKENFSIEILEHFPNRESLKKREKELINKEILKDSQCMNLKFGGEGGWGNLTKAQRVKSGITRRSFQKLRENPEWKRADIKRSSQRMKNHHIDGVIKYDNFKGKTHSIETKNKISMSKIGKKLKEENPSYGTSWIFNDELKLSKRVKRDDLTSLLIDGWFVGRKMYKPR